MGLRQSAASFKRELDRLTGIQLAVGLFFLSLFLIAPLVLMVGAAFYSDGSFSLAWFGSILGNPDYVSIENQGGLFGAVIRGTLYLWGYDHGVLLNSFIVALEVGFFCSIIGTISAFVITRYNFLGKSVLKTLILVPLLATPFVNAYVIGKLFNPRGGLINYLFYDLAHILPWRIDIDGLFGIVLAQTLSFYPIVYLNVQAALSNIDPSLEEAAENLGSKSLHLFRTVTLPLILPSLAAGAITTFIFSLEDLGATIGFIGARANPLAKRLVSYQVYSSFSEALTGGFSPKIAALSVILFVSTLTSFLLVKRYVSLRSYAMLSKGGRWSPRIRTPSLPKQILIVVFLVVLFLFASMPQSGTLILASTDWATSGAIPSKFTSDYFIDLLAYSDVSRAIINSLIYAFGAIVIMLLIGTSISYVVVKRNIPGKDILDSLATLPVAVPGITLAVGYFIFFSQFFKGTILDPLLDPVFLIIIGYSVRRLPFIIRSVNAGLQQIDKSLEESSLNLGAGRITTLTKIVLPLIAGHLIGGALLGFVYSMAEVSISVTLGSLNESREPITYYISRIVGGTGAVGAVSIGASMCVLLMMVQITAMTVSNYILKQKASFLGV